MKLLFLPSFRPRPVTQHLHAAVHFGLCLPGDIGLIDNFDLQQHDHHLLDVFIINDQVPVSDVRVDDAGAVSDHRL